MRLALLSVLISVHLWPAAASAAELALSIVRQSDGASTITVLPGTTVNYEIRGGLSDTSNEGLAFWSADLEFVTPAAIGNHTAGSPPSGMTSFVKNAGFSNPAGYAGTAIAGKLVQLGGGQNTIDNDTPNSPYPMGDVALDVAHSTTVLSIGTYTVPSNAGPGEQHVLKLTACLASVIDDNDISAPYATHAVMADCDTATLTIGTPPSATVTSAVSRKANASGPGGFCDLALIPGVKSDMRTTRITEVRIAFDTAPGNPAGSGTGITVEQKTCASPNYASYSGSSSWTESVTTGNTLVLAFSPALENARTYRINLGALITATTGQSVEVRGLIADVDDNGDISGIDRSEIVEIWSSTGFSCNTDLDSSGATNATDRSIWVGADTGPETCAP